MLYYINLQSTYLEREYLDSKETSYASKNDKFILRIEMYKEKRIIYIQKWKFNNFILVSRGKNIFNKISLTFHISHLFIILFLSIRFPYFLNIKKRVVKVLIYIETNIRNRVRQIVMRIREKKAYFFLGEIIIRALFGIFFYVCVCQEK